MTAHYRNVYITETEKDQPPARGSTMQRVRDADLVVLCHADGTFTVYKDRHGVQVKRKPFDDLPGPVKREIGRRM